ncbi:MAG: alkaline phosphatase [Sphingomonadaceae bacterium]
MSHPAVICSRHVPPMRALLLPLAAAALLAGCATVSPADRPTDARERAPRNIIVMIADGSGYSSIRATRFWSGAPLAVDSPDFLHAPMAVSQLSTRNQPVAGPEGLAQTPDMEWDRTRGCSATPLEGEVPALYGMGIAYPRGFVGYEWNRITAPDSANTMSALMTGVRSYNNAINVDGNGRPQTSLARIAHETGRAVGIVTTSAIADATPAAAGGAHSVSRALRNEITAQLFGRGEVTLIAGAGNPDWTDDATRRDKPDHRWFSPETWAQVKAGAPVGGPQGPRWTLVEDADAVRAMAAGTVAVPARLAAIVKAFEGVQQYRGGIGPSTDEPFATPLLADQPSLADMTRSALRRLDGAGAGFFLMVEESNTDRASHANNLGRVIEARLAFEDAVRAVVSHVSDTSTAASWNNTLLIVTADHDHLLFGPDGATIAFQPVADSGKGRLPAHRWLGNGHSNLPVPLFVRGAGAGVVLSATLGGEQLDGRAAPPATPCEWQGPVLDQAMVGRALLQLSRDGARK